MSSGVAPDVDLSLPDLELDLLEDVSPPVPPGFLRLVRRRLRVRYPDGERSEPFVYDELDRSSLDAVVIAAHYSQAGQRWVYLRSALRPPVRFRDPLRSPTRAGESGLLWELPAGLIEPGEQSAEGVLEAGRRELEEELGFSVPAADLQALGPPTWACPGITSEQNFFLQLAVRPEQRAEPSLDGSALERHGRVVALPLQRALELCRSGRIPDAKTELGLRRLAELPDAASGARSNE